MFLLTDLGELLNATDVSQVIVKRLTEDETEAGELLPPEDRKVVFVGVAIFVSRCPDLIVTADRPTPDEALADIKNLLRRLEHCLTSSHSRAQPAPGRTQ